MRFSFFVAFLSLAILAKGSDNPDDPNGSKFYLAKPSCDYYRCQVKTHPGAVLPIEWLNPIKGKIDIFFNPEDDQKGLKRYTIAKSIGAHNNKDKCNAEGQNGCGAFDWTVPADVKPGNYSVEIHSLKQKKVHGYSDIVTVLAGKKKRDAPVKEEEKKKDATKKHEHHKNATEPVKHEHKHKNATKSVKHEHKHKNSTESAKHEHKHKNSTESAKHEHKHKNSTESAKYADKHKNATEPVKHHHKGKVEHAKNHHKGKIEHSKHHHKNATKSAKHEHKKHINATKTEEEKGKKHHKQANKTQTSEHKRKRMVQTALY